MTYDDQMMEYIAAQIQDKTGGAVCEYVKFPRSQQTCQPT